MKKSGKSTKIERTEEKKRLIDYHQKGEGLFVFKNRSKVASLELPKPSADGKKWIAPGATWEGDSYFFSMIPENAVLVREISEPKKEERMENKLILDQPDQVTKTGKVEHKVSEDLALNEVSPEGTQKERDLLINEDPLSGVTIIRD